jgi:hypothetical protein
MPGRPRQQRNAAHEGAAYAEDVYVHENARAGRPV